MGRFGKFKVDEVAKEIQKFLTKDIPELDLGSEKTLRNK